MQPELGHLALVHVGVLLRLRLGDEPRDLGLGQAAGRLHRHRLLLAGAEILGVHADDAVGVDVEAHLDLRNAARRRRNAEQLELGERLVVLGHLALALQHVHLDERLVVDRRREDLCPRVGMVVLLRNDRVNTPPAVSTPSDSGVTSSSSTSCTAPFKMPAWIAAPTATTSSGSTRFDRLLAEELLHHLLHARHARLPADEDDLIDLLRAACRRRASRALHGSSVRCTSSSTSVSSLPRVSRVCRCSGPAAVAAMNGRLTSVSSDEDSSCLARSAASLSRCSAIFSLRRSMSCAGANCSASQVDDAPVEVLAAEVGVAVGRAHVEDAAAQLEDRDVEGAAAEIVDGDALARAAPFWPCDSAP